MSPDPELASLLAGATSAGFMFVSLFFLKFWRRTGDGLFGAFAAAFGLMALSQALQVLLDNPSESLSAVFMPRLAGFLLIIWAILRKNLGAKD